jgi:hypothetical protein
MTNEKLERLHAFCTTAGLEMATEAINYCNNFDEAFEQEFDVEEELTKGLIAWRECVHGFRDRLEGVADHIERQGVSPAQLVELDAVCDRFMRVVENLGNVPSRLQ